MKNLTILLVVILAALCSCAKKDNPVNVIPTPTPDQTRFTLAKTNANYLIPFAEGNTWTYKKGYGDNSNQYDTSIAYANHIIGNINYNNTNYNEIYLLSQSNTGAYYMENYIWGIDSIGIGNKDTLLALDEFGYKSLLCTDLNTNNHNTVKYWIYEGTKTKSIDGFVFNNLYVFQYAIWYTQSEYYVTKIYLVKGVGIVYIEDFQGLALDFLDTYTLIDAHLN